MELSSTDTKEEEEKTEMAIKTHYKTFAKYSPSNIARTIPSATTTKSALSVD